MHALYTESRLFVLWGSKSSKYFSTLSSPQSSFTTGMVAGTSKLNEEPFEPKLLEYSFLASLIAARVAQWTDAARRRGGSPEAANS